MAQELVRIIVAFGSGTPDDVQVVAYGGHNRVGAVPVHDLDLLLPAGSAPEVDTLLGQGVEIRILHGDAVAVVRRLIVVGGRLGLDAAGRSLLRLQVAPRAWRLGLRGALRVHTDRSVPEILAATLSAAGFTEGTDFDLRLRHDYPRRDFTLQYRETDLAFVQRLCEHWGISFFFAPGEQDDVMVFADDNVFWPAVGDGGGLDFVRGGERRDVVALEAVSTLTPDHYAVRDYNFRTPDLEIAGVCDLGPEATWSMVEYGGNVASPEEAAFLARIRGEALACTRQMFRGEAADPEVVPGRQFTLRNHPHWPDRPFVVVAADARFELTGDTAGGAVERPEYQVWFEAVAADRHWRPACHTPRPRIDGVLSGLIESSSNDDYGQTDSEGCYRVRLLVADAETDDGQPYPVVRMAQAHGGAGHGMHFPLRPGTEVLLAFTDGDPDRPVILGAAPNPRTPSVIDSGSRNNNVLRTHGGNQLGFEDTFGARSIGLTVPHDDTQFQLGSEKGGLESGAILQTAGSISAVSGAVHSAIAPIQETVGEHLSFKSRHIVAFAYQNRAKARAEAVVALPGTVARLSRSICQSVIDFRENQAKNWKTLHDLQDLPYSRTLKPLLGADGGAGESDENTPLDLVRSSEAMIDAALQAVGLDLVISGGQARIVPVERLAGDPGPVRRQALLVGDWAERAACVLAQWRLGLRELSRRLRRLQAAYRAMETAWGGCDEEAGQAGERALMVAKEDLRRLLDDPLPEELAAGCPPRRLSALEGEVAGLIKDLIGSGATAGRLAMEAAWRYFALLNRLPCDKDLWANFRDPDTGLVAENVVTFADHLDDGCQDHADAAVGKVDFTVKIAEIAEHYHRYFEHSLGSKPVARSDRGDFRQDWALAMGAETFDPDHRYDAKVKVGTEACDDGLLACARRHLKELETKERRDLARLQAACEDSEVLDGMEKYLEMTEKLDVEKDLKALGVDETWAEDADNVIKQIMAVPRFAYGPAWMVGKLGGFIAKAAKHGVPTAIGDAFGMEVASTSAMAVEQVKFHINKAVTPMVAASRIGPDQGEATWGETRLNDIHDPLKEQYLHFTGSAVNWAGFGRSRATLWSKTTVLAGMGTEIQSHDKSKSKLEHFGELLANPGEKIDEALEKKLVSKAGDALNKKFGKPEDPGLTDANPDPDNAGRVLVYAQDHAMTYAENVVELASPNHILAGCMNFDVKTGETVRLSCGGDDARQVQGNDQTILKGLQIDEDGLALRFGRSTLVLRDDGIELTHGDQVYTLTENGIVARDPFSLEKDGGATVAFDDSQLTATAGQGRLNLADTTELKVQGGAELKLGAQNGQLGLGGNQFVADNTGANTRAAQINQG